MSDRHVEKPSKQIKREEKEDKVPPKNNEQKNKNTKKAGLLFDVSRTRRVMQKFNYEKKKLQKTAPVFMTAVVEYLTAELLEGAFD